MKKSIKSVLVILLSLTIFFGISIPSCAQTTEEIIFPPMGKIDTHEGYDVLAFTSDIHNKTGNASANRLAGWLDNVTDQLGSIDFFGSCGDLADGSGAAVGDAYWTLAKTAMDAVRNVKKLVFTTGNHEQDQGSFLATTNDAAKNILMTGEAAVAEDANYKVYAFGATQASYGFREDEIEKLDKYLEAVPADCPVFILSHFPLHNEGSRTVENIEQVIAVLNQYPNAIFLWGHTHTDADKTEKHYDQVFKEEIDGTPIRFTYAAAGCMSDSENNAGSAAVKGKGILITVEDGEIGDTVIPKVTMVYADSQCMGISPIYEIDITGTGKQIPQVTEIDVGDGYEKVSSLSDGGQYLIAYKNGTIALNTANCNGYINNNNYHYSGFKGQAVSVTGDTVTGNVWSDMVWKAEKADGNKWMLKNLLTGKYLNAEYSSSGSSPYGRLFLADEADPWTLSNSQLKSTKANKTLAFDEEADISPKPYTGTYDFFTVRSTGDPMVFYQVTGNPVQEPAPKPVPEEKSLEPVKKLKDGHSYLLTSCGSLLTAWENSGYENNTGYVYTGLEGVPLTYKAMKLSNWLYENMVFDCEKVDGGFALRNRETGLYLNSAYGKEQRPVIRANGGDLFLGKAKEAWKQEGNHLLSCVSQKYFTYDTTDASNLTSGASDFFTIRSSGTAVTFYAVTEDTVIHQMTDLEPSYVSDYTKADQPEDGKSFLIAYANRALAASKNAGTQNGYSGLGCKTICFREDGTLEPIGLTQELLWIFEKVGSGKFKIKNQYTGQYLSSTYTSSWLGSAKGALLLTDHDGDTWAYQGKELVSKQTGKHLAFEMPADYFTIHSEGNPVNLYYVGAEAAEPCLNDLIGSCISWEEAPISDNTFCIVLNGYAVGLNKLSGFTLKQIKSASQFYELDDSFQWTVTQTPQGYTFENRGNAGKYLAAKTESSLLSTKATPIISASPYVWQVSGGQLSVTVSPQTITVKSWTLAQPTTNTLTYTGGKVAFSTKAGNSKLFAPVKSPAVAHEMEEIMRITPGCTEDGSILFRCRHCGAALYRRLPATGHLDLEPADGQCDLCGKELGTVAEPKLYSVTVDGETSYYAKGSQVTIRAKDKLDSVFRSWDVAGGDLSDLTLTESEITFQMPASDLIFTSKWEKLPTYVLLFDSKGGTSFDFVTALAGSGVDLTNYQPTKTGYTFRGWYLDKNLLIPAGSSVVLSENTTVYADWTKNETDFFSSVLSGIKGLRK